MTAQNVNYEVVDRHDMKVYATTCFHSSILTEYNLLMPKMTILKNDSDHGQAKDPHERVMTAA